MDKVTFLKELGAELAALAPDVRQTALGYCEEYFTGLSADEEARVLKSLGSPRRLAQAYIDASSKVPAEETQNEVNAPYVAEDSNEDIDYFVTGVLGSAFNNKTENNTSRPIFTPSPSTEILAPAKNKDEQPVFKASEPAQVMAEPPVFKASEPAQVAAEPPVFKAAEPAQVAAEPPVFKASEPAQVAAEPPVFKASEPAQVAAEPPVFKASEPAQVAAEPPVFKASEPAQVSAEPPVFKASEPKPVTAELPVPSVGYQTYTDYPAENPAPTASSAPVPAAKIEPAPADDGKKASGVIYTLGGAIKPQNTAETNAKDTGKPLTEKELGVYSNITESISGTLGAGRTPTGNLPEAQVEHAPVSQKTLALIILLSAFTIVLLVVGVLALSFGIKIAYLGALHLAPSAPRGMASLGFGTVVGGVGVTGIGFAGWIFSLNFKNNIRPFFEKKKAEKENALLQNNVPSQEGINSDT